MERKQLYGYFKWQTDEISYEKTWTLRRKKNFKRETEYRLIIAQNNAKKQRLKQKSIIYNGIASVDYVVRQTKPLII